MALCATVRHAPATASAPQSFLVYGLFQKLWHHCNIYCDSAGFVTRKQLGCGSSPRLILEIDIGELLSALVAHDKGCANVLDRPQRGKRRVVICGFAAKPSATSETGGLALSPIRFAWLARNAHGNVGCRTNTERFSMVRLRTSICSRWHLSYLFSRASRGFDRWAGSGGYELLPSCSARTFCARTPTFAPAPPRNKHMRAPVRCGRGRQNIRRFPRRTTATENHEASWQKMSDCLKHPS